jgi:membrane fusion protein (multidrug efflux system)
MKILALPFRALASALFAFTLLAGCGKEDAKAPPQRPPVDVTVMTVAARDTPVSFEFVGQTQSSREVEIRARVDGFLEKRLYVEGDLVRAGQPLFQIDRKPLAASLQSAKGELAQQQATLDVSAANLARIKPLAEQNAVSKKDLDDAIGSVQKARAAVIAAQGQVQTAELNLGYTLISSPLTGLSSYAKLQEGTYLSASNNLLTYIAQLDPIWVNFSISENEFLRYRDEVQRGVLRLPKDNAFDIEVVMADGTIYPERGHIGFADPSFSKETGTFLVRSVLANPKGQLRPGQFVKVNVIGAVRPHSIVIPQRAVQQGAKSHFVWVVGKDGKAEQRPVVVGTWDGDNWFILDGLKDSDAIVIDGAIRVSGGAALKTTPYAPKPEAVAAPRKAAEPMSVEQTQMAESPKNSPKDPPTQTRGAAKVYFEKDSDVLTPQGAQALGPLARMLAGDPMLAVDIAGYTDKSGGSTRNAQLAKDRAKAVRAALIAQGARPEQTSLKVPAATTGGPDSAEARRVDVIPTRVAQAGKKALNGTEAAAPR